MSASLVQPTDVRLFEVAGALTAEASNAEARWAVRRGLLLELEDREGRIGQGEASPLPGFSQDTLAEARADLLAVEWEALPAIDLGDELLLQVGRVLDEAGLNAPSARFAAETALLDLAGQLTGEPIHVLLAGPEDVGAAAGERRQPLGATRICVRT